MEFNNILKCKTPTEFYDWLLLNSTIETECWIECKKGKPNGKEFNYIDAVYVALCFGWIDSIHRKNDKIQLQRFSPRTKKSPWGELNKERCRWLINKGYMQAEGYQSLPDLNNEYKFDRYIMAAIRKDEQTSRNFDSFPELYRRIRISNIQRERKNKIVYQRMLKNFLDKTKKGIMYGEWNDFGRLQ